MTGTKIDAYHRASAESRDCAGLNVRSLRNLALPLEFSHGSLLLDYRPRKLEDIVGSKRRCPAQTRFPS